MGKIDLPVFLQQKLEAKDGDVVEIFNDFYENNPLFQYQKDGQMVGDKSFILSQPFDYTEKGTRKSNRHTYRSALLPHNRPKEKV